MRTDDDWHVKDLADTNRKDIMHTIELRRY